MKKTKKNLHSRKTQKTSHKIESYKLDREELIDLTDFIEVEMKGSRIIVKPKTKTNGERND